jgi:DNA helicase HerA-like ATPase
LAIEVRMIRTKFDAPLLKQIATVRARIADRLHADANKYVRDSRYADADRRLEFLQLEGTGIRFEVSVRSKRPLHDVEVSALSAALFGSPHDDNQHGHLSTLRSIYPHEDAVASFFGILASAIGPAIERRHINALDALDGNVIGTVKSGHKVRMAVASPRSHTYVIGRPGSGKSTLLLNLIHQDIANGDTVVLIDPHGDLWADVAERVPAARRKDLMLIHMGDPVLQPQLNLFDLGPGDPAEARARVVDTFYQLVRRLMFSGLTIDATGPMFNKYFRAALMLLLEANGADAKLEDFETVFTDSDFRDELRTKPGVSKQTAQQWEQILAVHGNDHTIESVTPWITSKMSMLTQSAILRPILGSTKTSFTFDQVLAENKICLINLANGSLGQEAAGLLGGLLTHRLEQAAKRQATMALENRRKASVYFDEFHTFASEFLRPLMAETRKYGLRVTLANQTLSQMINNDISGGVFREVLGNCANTIVFAVDVEDARYLAPRFGGKIDPVQLVAQPNYQAICQFQTKNAALGPFAVKTPTPPPVPDAPPF